MPWNILDRKDTGGNVVSVLARDSYPDLAQCESTGILFEKGIQICQ